MTETVEFKITATPPLVDTVSGEGSVLDGMPYQKEFGKLIVFPKTTEDKERGAKLGVSSDFITFTFVVDGLSLSPLCRQIANGILSQAGIQNSRILVEGVKADNVIYLKGTGAQELADRISAIAIAT